MQGQLSTVPEARGGLTMQGPLSTVPGARGGLTMKACRADYAANC